MRNYLIQYIFIIGLGISSIFSQAVSKTGTSAGQFFKIGVGSRAIGLGGAFTAIADDASSLYWNPSGIANNKTLSIFVDHYDWILDIEMDYFGFIIPLGNAGNLGISTNYLHMGEMDVTSTKNPEGTGEKFSAASYLGQISYARNLTERFSLGSSVKLIKESIWNSAATGIAIDIGTLYESTFPGLKLGMSISNYGSKMKMDGRDLLVQTDLDPSLESDPENLNSNLMTDEFDLPMIFRFGISFSKKLKNGFGTILAIDAIHPSDNTESINLGTEFNYNNIGFIRFGYRNLFKRDLEQKLSVGCGIALNYRNIKYHIDYSYTDFEILGSPQKLTITFVLR